MTPLAMERVFGRDRLQMVTGRYVEVFREAAAPGERRRYTKRFLSLTEGDFTHWTEREWRLLARLVGHGVRHVPEIVLFDRGQSDKTALVQTYDAGVTVDHWATLLPVRREGQVLRHVFRDCAHWWALAENFLLALKEIHQLQLVHLDIKADNVCIPLAPTLFDPQLDGGLLFPAFEQLALIDFAFSLVTGERLEYPLPIGAQPNFPYQSPRLLDALAAGRRGDMQPTRELDWRCDMFSLAALLERLLPPPKQFRETGYSDGWSDDRYIAAKTLLLDIREAHDGGATRELPHDRLVESARDVLRHRDLTDSLDRGWTLAARSNGIENGEPTVPVPLTPLTRIEAPSTHLLAETPTTHLPTVVEERAVEAAQETTAEADLDATPPTLLFPDEPTQLMTVVEDRVDGAPHEPIAEAEATLPTLASLPLPEGPTQVVTGMEARVDNASHELVADAEATPSTRLFPEEPTQILTVVEERAAMDAEETAAAADATPPADLLPVQPPVTAVEPRMLPDAAMQAQTGAASPAPPMPAAVPATEAEPRTPTDPPEPAVALADPAHRPLPVLEAAESAAARIDSLLSATSPVIPGESATMSDEPDPLRNGDPAPDAIRSRRQRRTLGYAAAAVAAVSLLAVIANVASPDRRAKGPSVAATRPAAASDPRAGSAGALERRSGAPTAAPGTARSETPAPTAAASGAGEPVLQAGRAESGVDRPTAPAPSPTPAPSIAAAAAADKPPVPSKPPEESGQAVRDATADALLMPIPQAATQVERVLRAAARAEATPQDRMVLATIESLEAAPRRRPAADADGRRSIARRLNASARDAFWNRRNAAEALALQQKAFDANPLDPEIAGNLAFYHLKTNPPQPEAARRVALHALAAAAPQAGARRVEDWGNLAVANALTERPQEAANALYVMLAVSKDLDRTCRSALSMVASFGPRLKPPVEAMFARIDSRGQARGAPYCSWPPRWSAGQQFP